MRQPLAVAVDCGNVTQLHCSIGGDSESREGEFEMWSGGVGEGEGRERHCFGRYRASAAEPSGGGEGVAGARERCTEAAPVAQMYSRFAAGGLEYGPRFQTIKAAWRGGKGEAFGKLSVPKGSVGHFGVMAIWQGRGAYAD